MVSFLPPPQIPSIVLFISSKQNIFQVTGTLHMQCNVLAIYTVYDASFTLCAGISNIIQIVLQAVCCI